MLSNKSKRRNLTILFYVVAVATLSGSLAGFWAAFFGNDSHWLVRLGVGLFGIGGLFAFTVMFFAHAASRK